MQIYDPLPPPALQQLLPLLLMHWDNKLLSLKLNFLSCFCAVEKTFVDLWACSGGRFSLLSHLCHVTYKIWPLRCFDICHRKILISDFYLKKHYFYTDIIQSRVAGCQAETAPSREFFFSSPQPPFPLNQNFLPHKRMASIVLFLSGSKSPVSEAMASVSSELAAAKQLPPGAKSYYLWMLLLLPLIVQSHEAPIKEGGGELWPNRSPNYHAFYELMPGGGGITFQLSWLPVVWRNDVQREFELCVTQSEVQKEQIPFFSSLKKWKKGMRG